MAKQPPSAPRSTPRPAPKQSVRQTNWRRGQRPTWGSFWSLLWKRADDDDELARRADPKRRRYAFRVRLSAAAITVAILCAVVVIIALRRSPTTTPLAAIAVCDYPFPVPPNSYASEDLDAFYALGHKEQIEATRTDVRFVGKRPGERSGNTKILDELRNCLNNDPNCVPGGPGKNVVFVYVSAHGVTNAKGEAYLLDRDCDPLDSSTWTSLKLLLDELRDHPTFGAAGKVHTVLFLDCSRAPEEWQLGQVYNSFVKSAQLAVKDLHHPRLMVISSADTGQTAWTAPALGGSVFGFFLRVGLAGAADANGKGGITLAELSDYLRDNVSGWTRACYSTEQTPLVFEHDEKLNGLALVHSGRGDRRNSQGASVAVKMERERRAAQIKAEEEWVRKNSQLVAQRYQEQSLLEQGARGLHPASVDPLAWGLLRQRLLYLDRLLMAGRNYHQVGSDAFTSELDKVESLLEEFQKPRLDLSRSVLSFPLVEQFQSRRAGPEKPGEPATHKGAWDKVLQAAESPAGVKREQLKLPSGPAAPAEPRPANRSLVEPIEIHFLRMLDAYLPEGAAVEKELASALRARWLAERVAAPTDLRAHAWIRGPVDAGDALRRAAEDKLFIGSTESLEQLPGDWQRIFDPDPERGPYQRAEDLAETVSKALRRRDTSWADALYLASWTLARENPDSSTLPQLQTWIANLRELSAELHAPPAGDAVRLEDVEKLRRLERDLGGRHAELMESYKSSRPDPSGLRMDEAQARRIEQLLRWPPLDVNIAKALHANQDVREKYFKYLFAPEQSATASSAASASATIDDADQRARLWKYPLALECVRLARAGDTGGAVNESFPDAEQDQDKLLAHQGETFRQALRTAGDTAGSLEGKARELFSSGAKGAGEPPPADAAADKDQQQERQLALHVRQRLSEADLVLRRAAPLLAERPASDATLLLAKLDALTECLWHCRRSLDDFWGPWPPANEAYFAHASRRYLEAAETIWPGQQNVRMLAGSLYALRDRRVAAAEAGSGVIPFPDEADLTVEEPTVPHQINLNLVGNIPRGEAAVFIRRYGSETGAVPMLSDLANDSRTWRRRGVPVTDKPETEAGVSHRLAKSDLEEAQVMQAASLFRGHLRLRDFPIRKPGLAEMVAFERPRLVPPTITVVGKKGNPKLVLIILDCSASMSSPIAKAGPEEAKFRIDVAKEALNDILDELPDATFKIGLRVYGHRAAWSDGPEVGVRYSELFPEAQARQMQAAFKLGKGPRPPVPNNDVEEVFRPEHLTDEFRSRIRTKLGTLAPHGETPLCHAMFLAFEDLVGVYGDAVDRQIVVLTDGYNRQISAPDAFEDNLARLTESQLFSKLNGNRPRYENIKLDIVGLDMGQPVGKEVAQLKTLQDIARLQRGKFRPASDLDTLLKELKESIAAPRYEVQLEGGQVDPETDRPNVGKTWKVRENWNPEGKPALPYSVSLATSEGKAVSNVALDWGDSIHMVFDGKSLLHEFYAPPHRFVGNEKGFNVEGGYHVTAFVPERVGRGVEFPVAIQHDANNAGQFSGRPRHVWAEIRPTNYRTPQSGDPPVYHCYDPIFENERPKPVLRFVVPSWPEQAESAAIRIWFRTHDDKAAPLSQTLPWDRGSVKNIKLTAPGFEGLRFDVQTREEAGVTVVDVTERHDSAESRERVLRLQMFPPPDRGNHAYYREANMVKHHFVFLRSRPEKIEVTLKEDIQTGAITLPEGRSLEIRLPRK